MHNRKAEIAVKRHTVVHSHIVAQHFFKTNKRFFPALREKMRAYDSGILPVLFFERVGNAAFGSYVTHSRFDKREDDFGFVSFAFTHLFPFCLFVRFRLIRYTDSRTLQSRGIRKIRREATCIRPTRNLRQTSVFHTNSL